MIRATTRSQDNKLTESALYETLTTYLAGVLRVGKAEIDPARSFDEYGLDSIDAVIATDTIGRRLGIELSPEFLFKNNNVNAAVRALLHDTSSCDVPDAQNDTEDPIFFFPGGGGRDEPNLVRFRTATSFKFDVVSIGHWSEWVGHGFDLIVDRAVRHIEAVADGRPLRIVGYSQGGEAAFATALALERAGRTVRFVGLIDTLIEERTAYTIETSSVFSLKRWWKLLKYYFVPAPTDQSRHYGYRRIHAISGLWHLQRRIEQRRKFLLFIKRYCRPLFYGRGGVALDISIGGGLFTEMWADWLTLHQKCQLHAPVVLFRSQDPGPQDLGWAPLCTDLRVVSVSGDHHSMFDSERLERLTKQFGAALTQTEASKLDQSRETVPSL